MTDTVLTDPPPAAPPPDPPGSTVGDKIRFVLRGIGQTLITAGLVVLLFVVYEVYITNIFADREQHQVEANIQKTFESKGKDPLLQLPGSKDAAIPLGDGFANIYMPRLGSDFHYGIVEGGNPPDQSQLEKGPAHYGDTALPGQLGNFAMAGHRVGKGEPFLNLDKLQAGDPVIIETKSFWYVYYVKGQQHGLTRNDSDGIPGREIVSPSDGNVLLPVPNHPGKEPDERLLTMTTCNPKFTAQNRLVVFAELDSSATVRIAAKSGKAVLTMPPSIKALYSQESN